jgi:hypothetical protein
MRNDPGHYDAKTVVQPADLENAMVFAYLTSPHNNSSCLSSYAHLRQRTVDHRD